MTLTFLPCQGVVSLNSSEVPRQHLMAGAVIATLPVLVIFLWFEKYLVSGLTAGSVKGDGVTNLLNEQAIAILKKNDRGGFTIPTARLYPFQWNWDSAFVALGLATYDLDRAWTELEMLVSGQCDDGMIPSIVFRTDDQDYFLALKSGKIITAPFQAQAYLSRRFWPVSFCL